MQNILILLIIGLLAWDVIAHVILLKYRRLYHLIPLGALIHIVILIFTDKHD